MHFLPQYFFKKSSTLSKKWALIICTLFSPIALAVCNLDTPATTPSSDFTDHNDGTVTHNPTSLMWKVCSEGQTWNSTSCSGAITSHTWDVALQIPETLNSNEGFPSRDIGTPYMDWRLPTLKELKSIIELQCYSPAINATIFPENESSFYWSSSRYVLNDINAWGVHFLNGDDSFNDLNFNLRVRLVRNAQ